LLAKSWIGISDQRRNTGFPIQVLFEAAGRTMSGSGITVIIAHYAPAFNCEMYRNLLKETIESVRRQIIQFNVEIIVCDDGSSWSGDLSRGEEITEYGFNDMLEKQALSDLNVDRYLILPDVGLYRGTALKHRAMETAKYEQIVVLDDDHPFIRIDSLAKYNQYLEKYEFVRGRVIGPTGIPQLYFSPNAQGTNYGLRKTLYSRIGGFGQYLFTNGYGEDNDLLWRIYRELNADKSMPRRACYAGEIVTRDKASSRWAARSMNIASNVMSALGPNGGYPSFVADFVHEYGVHPSRNDARSKYKWVEIPSGLSFFSEFMYGLLYLWHAPQLFRKKLAGLKRRIRSRLETENK
jgi:hypothetical protein